MLSVILGKLSVVSYVIATQDEYIVENLTQAHNIVMVRPEYENLII